MKTRIFKFLLMFVLISSMVSVNADAQSFNLETEYTNILRRITSIETVYGQWPMQEVFKKTIMVGDDIRATEYLSKAFYGMFQQGNFEMFYNLELVSSGNGYEKYKVNWVCKQGFHSLQKPCYIYVRNFKITNISYCNGNAAG